MALGADVKWNGCRAGTTQFGSIWRQDKSLSARALEEIVSLGDIVAFMCDVKIAPRIPCLASF
jgi:hypothetical protein